MSEMLGTGRLSENEKDTPTVVQLVMTNTCNLNCTFCGGKYYMEGVDGETLPDTDQAVHLSNLLEVIKNNPELKQLNWTGGEPLLAYRKIREWFDIVKELRPDMEHCLMTNGLRIRADMIDVLKRFELITISFDGYRESERPLWAVVDDGKYEIFEVLAELDNWRVITVLTRDRIGEKRWYEDVLELHNALHHLKPLAMNFMLDTKMEKPLSPDHCLNLVYGYRAVSVNLTALNDRAGHMSHCGFERMFDDIGCNLCSEVVLVGADGTVSQLDNVPRIVETGCNQLAASIGIDAYKYLQKFLAQGKRQR